MRSGGDGRAIMHFTAVHSLRAGGCVPSVVITFRLLRLSTRTNDNILRSLSAFVVLSLLSPSLNFTKHVQIMFLATCETACRNDAQWVEA